MEDNSLDRLNQEYANNFFWWDHDEQANYNPKRLLYPDRHLSVYDMSAYEMQYPSNVGESANQHVNQKKLPQRPTFSEEMGVNPDSGWKFETLTYLQTTAKQVPQDSAMVQYLESISSSDYSAGAGKNCWTFVNKID